MRLLKRLIGLMVQKAPRNQYYLEIGTYFLRKGVKRQIGETFSVKENGRTQTYTVANYFYDFDKNRINHKLIGHSSGVKRK
ncbi:MAG: hypothetical protein ITG00_03415 [Flavobacterium sp.]|nr:hypothetical protein [Flavobacterium sp.]